MNRRRAVRVTDARARILHTARRLFAEQGLGNVSLRDVIRAAGVNPASVHYHFGSRLALLREVFREARTPLIAERRQLLERTRQSGESAAAKDVLHAFFWPIFSRIGRARDAQAAADLAFISQLRLDPSDEARAVLAEHERELDELFEAALFEALPNCPPPIVRVRMHLANSTAWDVAGQRDALRWTAAGPDEPVQPLYQAFLAFILAGFLQQSTAGPIPAADREPRRVRQRSGSRPARARRIEV